MAVVYALECTVNGFAYIGVTKSKLSKRLREHRCLCNTRTHHAVKLTEDWHRYGEAAFVIKVLEEAEHTHRGAHCPAEQRWIDHYAALGRLYNAHRRSTGLGGEISRKGVEASIGVPKYYSPEARLRMRLSQLGIPKNHGAKISATKRANRLKKLADDMACSSAKAGGAPDKEPA